MNARLFSTEKSHFFYSIIDGILSNIVKVKQPSSVKKGISWHIAVVSFKPIVDDADGSDVSSEFDESSSDSDSEEDEKLDEEKIETGKIRLDHRVYVHVFDQVTQDSDAVLSIIKHVFRQIKIHNSLIDNAYIRSDNAACYHSAQTSLSLPRLAETTGISIKRFDFSDPQGGKGTLRFYSTF